MRPLKGLWTLYQHHVLSLQMWAAFLFGLFLAVPEDKPSIDSRLDHLFWSGPTYLRILAWIAALHILLIASWQLLRMLARRRLRRADFFKRHAVARLAEWTVDSHWLSLGEVFEICCAPNLLEPQLGQGGAGWSPAQAYLRDLGDFSPSTEVESARTSWRDALTERLTAIKQLVAAL